MLIKDSEKKKFEDTLTVPKFGVIFLKFSFALTVQIISIISFHFKPWFIFPRLIEGKNWAVDNFLSNVDFFSDLKFFVEK